MSVIRITCKRKDKYLLPPLIHPVDLIRLGTLLRFQASALRSVQLVLTPFPYIVLFHLHLGVLDGSVYPLFNFPDELCCQDFYHLFVPFPLECLLQADVRGTGVWPCNTMLFVCLDLPFIGHFGKVILCCEDALAFKELVHCFLQDINCDHNHGHGQHTSMSLSSLGQGTLFFPGGAGIKFASHICENARSRTSKWLKNTCIRFVST